mgnify:CR=1 FL=1
MSEFHEARLPARLAFGCTGGVERRTEVVTLASGFERRTSPWARGRRRYLIATAARPLDEIAELTAFFEARGGRLAGFRFRDPADFKSCAPSVQPAASDQPIGVGDGTRKAFQLTKAYGTASRTIAKPVAGGGLCQTLDDALREAPGPAPFLAMPALVQPRLVAPELRIFVVGEQTFAFDVRSPSLDYRAQQDADVHAVPVPSRAAQPLHALMREFRMDFGAADFKTDPDSGELVFLELNTSPMFARFDAACGGALCRAMVEHLTAAR